MTKTAQASRPGCELPPRNLTFDTHHTVVLLATRNTGLNQNAGEYNAGLLPATRIPMTRFPYSISVQLVGIMFHGQFLERFQFSLYKLLLIFHLPQPLHKPLEREDTSLLFVYLKNIGTRNDGRDGMTFIRNDIHAMTTLRGV
jgi:hypothetical protein